MIRNFSTNRSFYWYLAIVFTAVSFTWSERLSTAGIILLIVHWVMDKHLGKKIMNLFQPGLSTTTDYLRWTMWLFFIYHLIALGWSHDMNEGWQSIEVKLTFFILPLLFSTEHYMTQKRMLHLLLIFSVSLMLSFLYAFVQSYLEFHDAGWGMVFSRMNISKAIMHPGYYSNYFALALVWSALVILANQALSKSLKWMLIFIIMFMIMALLLLISKTAILFLLCFSIYLSWLAAGKWQSGYRRWILFILFLGTFVAISSLIPRIRYRIVETSQQFQLPDKDITIQNSTGSRMVAWKAEWQLIADQWLTGYGTGEANAQLKNQLIGDGYMNLAADHMHTHNQVLHTWIDLGLVGLCLLLLFLFLAGRLAWLNKHQVAFWLVILIGWNLITDDMLEVQAGTVFFIFFLSLFLFRSKPTDEPLRV